MELFCSTQLSRSDQHTRNYSIKNLKDFSIYIAKKGMNPEALDGYPKYLEDSGLSHAAISNKVGRVKQFLRWCCLMGYAKERWHDYIPRIRSPALELPKIIRHEEYLKLREVCKDPDRDWCMVLGYSTGLRLKDCCYLTWNQVDRKKQIISLIPSKNMWKTRKPVYIPYQSDGDLHQLIEQRWANRENEPDIGGGKDYVSPVMALSYTANNKGSTESFRKIFDRAGLHDRSFKHFRSTFESRLANSGMNMALATAITGRSNINTLLRYVRPDITAAREGIGRAMDLHNTHEGFK